jgi:hypothetical protein
MGEVVLPEASPREREVQHVVAQLVEAYAFAEAHAILGRYLREIAERRQSHVETLYLAWRDLDPEARPDFLTFAHHRRRPEIEDRTHGPQD